MAGHGSPSDRKKFLFVKTYRYLIRLFAIAIATIAVGATGSVPLRGQNTSYLPANMGVSENSGEIRVPQYSGIPSGNNYPNAVNSSIPANSSAATNYNPNSVYNQNAGNNPNAVAPSTTETVPSLRTSPGFMPPAPVVLDSSGEFAPLQGSPAVGAMAPSANASPESLRSTPFYESSAVNPNLPTYTVNPLENLVSCSFRIAWRGQPHVWRGEISVFDPEAESLVNLGDSSNDTFQSPSSPFGAEGANVGAGRNPIRSFGVVNAVSLGVESDQSASFDVQDASLRIHHTSAREYDGYQITVQGRPGCQVKITLGHEKQEPQTYTIPFEDLYLKAFQYSIQETKVSVRRSVSDVLRVQLNTDCLVFSPGERLTGQLIPYQVVSDAQLVREPISIRIQLLHSREKFEIYQKEIAWSAPDGASIPLDIPLPREEGVYEVVVTAQLTPSNSLMPRLSESVNRTLENVRLRAPKELAQRKIQLVVLEPNAPANQTGELETKLVAEIDPTSPRWWETFEKLSQFPLGWRGKSWEGPMGNGNFRIRTHALGQISELASNPEQGEPCWEAYTFPIERVGAPHILEIEYPSDMLQTTGISIVEPNSNGSIVPSNLDSGLHVSEDQLCCSSAPCWRRHRIVFWPRTKSPILLVYNLRSDTTSCYGKIRVLAVTGKLPKTFDDELLSKGRLFAAYLDRPQFPELFSASEAPNENSTMFLDDWGTFYESGSRMIEYLNYVGYNGAMISVNSDGSAIWPCSEMAPTPRYDTGAFFNNGQDPVRKDVLELLMRLFDRQKMRLIPALEFASPHPLLEQMTRSANPQTSGLEWVGPNGKTILDAYAPENGLGMYYNILHPQVQQAVLDTVSHLGQRYLNHPSFAGLSLQLTDNSWLILPPPQWGVDDETVRRFSADTGVQVPGSGANRFNERARFLTGPASAEWLNWRSEQLGNFYLKLYSCLQPKLGSRKLYLSGAKLFTRCHKSALIPKLPQASTTASALLQCGLHGEYGLGKYSGIVLLYTQREINGDSLAQSATQRQWRVMPDQESFFSSREGTRTQASLFYHPSRRVHLTSFDEKSPFKPTYAALNAVPSPAGLENRRRFASSLANWDTQEFFDGGWLLSVGEEDSERNIIAGIRSLPGDCFTKNTNVLNGNAMGGGSAMARSTDLAKDAGPKSASVAGTVGSQAVVYRTFVKGNVTWAYAINTTPFVLSGRVRVNVCGSGAGFNGSLVSGSGMADGAMAQEWGANRLASSGAVRMENVLQQLSQSDRCSQPLTDNTTQLVYDSQSPVWQSNFAPFEIQVVRFSAPVSLVQSSVVWSPETLARMQKSLYDLADRSDSLKISKPMRILDNPDFELPSSMTNPIPQWFVWKSPNQSLTSKTEATIDVRAAANGKSSLRLFSDGAPLAVYSKEIVPEPTGRFTVSLWVKKEPQVPLRCFLRIKNGKKHLYRELVIKGDPQSGGAIPARESETGWKLYYFHINDLPLEETGPLCLGFELSEPGEVWIDDIQLSDLFFPENEQRILYKMLAPMGTKFTMGELEYCWKFQQGYWPQFLLDCVELGANSGRTEQMTSAKSYRAVGTNAAVAYADTATSRERESADKSDLGKWRLKNPLPGNRIAPNLNLGLGLRKKDAGSDVNPDGLSGSATASSSAQANRNLGNSSDGNRQKNNQTETQESKTESKSLWQRATDWMSWK